MKRILLILLLLDSACYAAENIETRFDKIKAEMNPRIEMSMIKGLSDELGDKALAKKVSETAIYCCTDTEKMCCSESNEFARLELEISAAIASKYKYGIDYVIKNLNLSKFEWLQIRTFSLERDDKDKRSLFIFNEGYCKLFYEDKEGNIHEYVFEEGSDMNFSFAEILGTYEVVDRPSPNYIKVLIQSGGGNGHGRGKTEMIAIRSGKLIKLFESVKTDSPGCQIIQIEMDKKSQLVCVEQVAYNQYYWPVIYDIGDDGEITENSLKYKDYLMKYYEMNIKGRGDKQSNDEVIKDLLAGSKYFAAFYRKYVKK